ncbi:MAG: Amidase [Firmicutes bacterium]|nr:Amidase [Bacillota bacterium]
MPIDEQLIAAIAREMHGRTDIDEATLTETAARVATLLAKVRLAHEQRLRSVAPAFSFDPGAPTYQTAPQQGAALWAGMAGSAGGSGYGGTAGTTGVTAGDLPAATPPAQTAQGPDFLWWSATDLAAAIRSKQLSPVAVTQAFLDRIAAVSPSLNAFSEVMAEEALAQARAAEAATGPTGPLHGVPVAVKDLIDIAGHRTTAGSRVLAENMAHQDATVTARLRAAGAIIIGKTATHEFAFGSTSDSPFHGPVRNPWDRAKIPAGSSGGSGAAVAAGLVPIAIGTDTGGSIRMPATHCGVVGLKPTYGRVSKAGVIPLSWSLDHIGPLAVSVRDAALVLQAIAGADPLDPAALQVPVADYAAHATPGDLRGVRIGLPTAWLETPIDQEVRRCFNEAVARLKDLGAEIVDVELPAVDVMTFINRLITFGEAGAFHAPLLKERAAEYAPDVRLRLELAQYVSARDYLLGQRLRAELVRQVSQVMATVDALVTPVVPIPPAGIGQPMWDYGDGNREPVVEAMVRFCAPFSVTGQPAFSLPAGFTAEGLPVGVQLVGKPFAEAALIRIAAAFETNDGRRNRRPSL